MLGGFGCNKVVQVASCCIKLLPCFKVVFWLYHLLEIRVMLILVVFHCVLVSFLSFDDVFFWRILGWSGWIGSFYAVNKQVSLASRCFIFL